LGAGTVAARLSHTPLPLAARGFHAPPQKIQKTGGSCSASSPLPFPAVSEGHRHLQKNKHTQTTVDFNFLSCSWICFFSSSP